MGKSRGSVIGIQTDTTTYASAQWYAYLDVSICNVLIESPALKGKGVINGEITVHVFRIMNEQLCL